MLETTDLLRDLIALYGPPGEEKAVREWLLDRVRGLGYAPESDVKGNVLVRIGDPQASATVLVTAHMDEIALMITKIESDGKIRVAASGGVFTWKWGEGPVDILTRHGSVPAILSYGCIHTNAKESVVEFARSNALPWERAYLFTGKSKAEQEAAGVRPGLRVVLGAARRVVTEFGDHIASYFLDDRADLLVWLIALDALRYESTLPLNLLFAATASEEVGGEGAQFIMRRHAVDICVALEIGPKTPEADFPIDANPTIWVRDGYAAMEAVDGELLTEVCTRYDVTPHWQYLSRGGSDASCAASKGWVARPVTLGFPVENSHGYEIMHRDAPAELARLLLAYLKAL